MHQQGTIWERNQENNLIYNSYKECKIPRNQFNQRSEASVQGKLLKKTIKTDERNGRGHQKWKNTLCLWTGIINIVKITLPKAIYWLNAIPIKIPIISSQILKKNPKIYMESQKTLNNRNNPEEKSTKLEISYYLTSKFTTKL